MSYGTNHGHITPRADGAKIRCGGPSFCAVCQEEVREEWVRAGGGIHGPNVETVTMPESDYFKFRAMLVRHDMRSSDSEKLDWLEKQELTVRDERGILRLFRDPDTDKARPLREDIAMAISNAEPLPGTAETREPVVHISLPMPEFDDEELQFLGLLVAIHSHFKQYKQQVDAVGFKRAARYFAEMLP